MVRIAKSSEAFSLIEVLVAIVIIGISIMGLMEMSIVVMRNNLKNEMRNKAVEMIDNHLQNLVNQSYDNITVGVSFYSDNESIRNISVEFKIVDNITKDASIEAKIINSEIKWKCCGKDYGYEVKTVVTKGE